MAHRAHGGGLHGQLHMAAVAAEPENLVALFEDLTVFQIFQQFQITLLVGLFDSGNALELSGQLQKALLLGGAGHFGVHTGPLLVLSGSGGHQIFGGGADAIQRLEPQLCVLFFVQGRFLKQRRDLLVALLFRLAGIVVILVPGLRLSGKRLPQIGLRFASLQFHISAPFQISN